jgi:hypothetical protein
MGTKPPFARLLAVIGGLFLGCLATGTFAAEITPASVKQSIIDFVSLVDPFQDSAKPESANSRQGLALHLFSKKNPENLSRTEFDDSEEVCANLSAKTLELKPHLIVFRWFNAAEGVIEEKVPVPRTTAPGAWSCLKSARPRWSAAAQWRIEVLLDGKAVAQRSFYVLKER